MNWNKMNDWMYVMKKKINDIWNCKLNEIKDEKKERKNNE